MTMKNDVKPEEGLTCHFIIDMRNLTHFDLSTLKSLQNLHFKWAPSDQRSRQELSFMTLKSDTKFEEKLTCGLQNDMMNLENFHQSTQKCQN